MSGRLKTSATRIVPAPDLQPECPGCGAGQLAVFYSQLGVPAQNVRLMATRGEALACPRGDIRLGHCGACGFIGNVAFDPRLTEYSERYEETQGFSPTFGAFADRLAHRLVERLGMRGKSVLEIGCGKGEFLSRVCRIGGNRGVGIDPAYRAGRLPAEDLSRLTFIQGLFPEDHGEIDADLVICRHTLEHIASVAGFMRNVRDALGQRPDTAVVFELPDVRRVLGECAFWDIYYEHCSYFSPASLARLFEATGFQVEETWLEYDDQYLLLLARPAPESGPWRPEPVEAVDEVGGLVARFGVDVSRKIRHWFRFVDGRVSQGRRVALWGAGSKAVAFLTTTQLDHQICAVVDINPHKQGRFLPGTGHEVLAPEALVAARPDDVLLMNPIYGGEVRESLRQLGVAAELHTL